MAYDYGKKFTAQEIAFYMTRPRQTMKDIRLSLKAMHLGYDHSLRLQYTASRELYVVRQRYMIMTYDARQTFQSLGNVLRLRTHYTATLYGLG